MTGYGKRNTEPQDEAHRVAQERRADIGRPAMKPGSTDSRRGDANWAWARSGAGYDWMDHAPLFEHRD
ncbi:hypothetical protein [Burkholderia sp. D-99]|uniref:hypothetical protein n=1 Tax=Burkholderia sp. D-99 TaxID=2717316 RepID=UPI001420F0DF|nr:hypothetical protein [Burkholderia sp. D-99]NHV25909.1 hypothetical protein [Burkholderia sp. D-99]